MRGGVLTGMLVAALLVVAGPATAAPAGSTLLVSRPSGTGPVPPALDNASGTGAISDTGRYAVFTSYADGFAPGTFSGSENVFLRDRVTHTTTLVSRSDGMSGPGANGNATSPAIAIGGDGHVLVTFTSSATNLVDHGSGQKTNGSAQVWLRDVTAGTTTLISRASGTPFLPANDGGADPDQLAPIAVTPGGPVVAFFAASANLGGGTGGIFLRTVNANATEPISCVNQDCTVANPQNAPAFHPALRLVGSILKIAFDSRDASLTGDGSNHSQVVLAQAAAPASVGAAAGAPGPPFTRISDSGHTPGNEDSWQPSISSDGADVAFLSRAATLTPDSPSPNPGEAFVHHISTDANALVSRATGTQTSGIANSAVQSVQLGGAGTTLRAVFDTGATNLGPAASNTEAYVRDLTSHTTALLNRDGGATGAAGNSFSDAPVISTDGSLALFLSRSSNLGLGGGDHFVRVYLRTLPSVSVGGGTLELISRPSGTAPFHSLTDGSFTASGQTVSANGRYVTFTSASSGLSGQDANNTYVYVRDLLTNRTILVSRATGANGKIANGEECEAGGISAAGRFVEFDCDATNLSPQAHSGVFQVYVRDLLKNTTTLVSRASGVTGAPAAHDAFAEGISADGNAVLIESTSRLEPAGTAGIFHLYARNLSTNRTTLVDRANGANGTAANQDIDRTAIDADGNRVIWTTTAVLAGAPADGFEHAYVRDLRAGTTTLVSRADGASGASAAGDSFDVSIDAAGDIVAFSSDAQNLGAPFVNDQVFLRNLKTGRTVLVSHRSDGVALPASAQAPSLDAAGDRVALTEAGSGFADDYEVVVVDVRSGAITLASRANGVSGPPGDGNSSGPSLDPTGNCVAFTSESTNLADGFLSSDFKAVHLRVLRGRCPLPPPRPVLAKLRISPRHVHAHGRRRGARITFTLNVAVRVVLRIDQLRPGHLRQGHCLLNARRGVRCTVVRHRETLRISGRPGNNVVRFTRRVQGRLLPLGRYRLTATPRGGRSRSLTFVLIR